MLSIDDAKKKKENKREINERKIEGILTTAEIAPEFIEFLEGKKGKNSK